MNLVIAGLGSIGSRHLDNLARWHPGIGVTVWHQERKPHDGSRSSTESQTVYSLDAALACGPTAALIAGPASSHVSTALEFVRRGVPVFVEKPLAARLDGVSELIDATRANGVVLMVGYCLRFCAPIKALRQAVRSGMIGRVLSVRAEVGRYLPDWRPSRDYRDTASARADRGGGALLELSHEIDYIRWIVGEISAVTARVAKTSDLDLDVEDMAEIVFDFSDGALGSVHLDMVQRVAFRGCRIVGSEGTLTWDANDQAVYCYRPNAPQGIVLDRGQPDAFDAMYRAELDGFLRALQTGSHEGATAEDGRRVLEIVAAAKLSSMRGRTVGI